VTTFVGGTLVAAERAGRGFRPAFRTVVTGKDEQGVVEELVPGPPGVGGALEIIKEEPDLDIVLVDEVQPGASRGPAVHVTTCSRHLVPGNGLAGGVRGVIGGTGEVEKEGFARRSGTAKKLKGPGVENGADFVEDIGAVKLFALAGSSHDPAVMNPAGAPTLSGGIGICPTGA
jgi:hypothetical protein